MLGELDALLAEAGVTAAQIDALVVGVGPGTFTGVRVGITTARALAMATGVRAVGVGALETMAHPCPVDLDRPRVAVIDARRAELFVAAYDASGRELRAPAHVRRDALAAWGEGLDGAVALGEIDGLDDTLAAAGWRPYRSGETDLPTGESLLALGHARLSSLAPASALEPSYLRPPDAALPTRPLALPSGDATRLDSAPSWMTSAPASAIGCCRGSAVPSPRER